MLQYALGITSNWFFKQMLCNFKNQIHTFFFLLRSSILKLNYLYDFLSSISENWPYGSPLNPLSNAIGLTWFGFFKTKLCPISHDDLIMYSLSRAKLYDLPCVTVSSFSSEIDTQETKVCAILDTLYRIPIWYSKRELWWFSQGHLF